MRPVVITAGNGKWSVDTVTVTIGGRLHPRLRCSIDPERD